MPNVAGVVKTDPMNKTKGKHIHNYSTFKESLSYRIANGLRFGDYTPSFVMEGIENDSISVNSKDLIDSLSLNAPFKGSIRKIKESFKVPNMAILPMNWDKIYVQPSNGSDVPRSVNCVLYNFPQQYSAFWMSLRKLLVDNLPSASSTDADVCAWLTALVRTLILGEYVYSTGSLLNVCGYKGSAQFFHYLVPNGTYDEFMDAVISLVFGQFDSLPLRVVSHANLTTSTTNKLVQVKCLAGSANPTYIEERLVSFRYMLEVFREDPWCFFDSSNAYQIVEFRTNVSDFATAVAALNTAGGSTAYLHSGSFVFILPDADANPSQSDDPDLTLESPNNLNLSRILAYQLVCAHFYSNSSVDFIYTAEIYREYIHWFESVILGNNQSYYNFQWNGRSISLDYLSGRLLQACTFGVITDYTSIFAATYAQLSANTSSSDKSALLRFSILAAIWSFRKSLRYGDYFVGSRPRPLAPINTDVAVNSSNAVSVIDITRNIQAQRFANSVMRSRQKIEEYVKSLFGKAPAPDYHNPFFLSREAEVIYGDEVQNTADAQANDANSRTSNFASGMNRFTFTFNNYDEHPCIYLQIISFDVKRFYTRSVDRQFLVSDRYDMFNPDFQYIGDQPIFGIELGYPNTNDLTLAKMNKNFAYTTRDMEYKQRFDVACGPFACGQLPGWILTDRDRSKFIEPILSPDFIRSSNTELDQFFLSLTGFSLGTYFHFVCVTNNLVDAKRAMAVDPQILA